MKTLELTDKQSAYLERLLLSLLEGLDQDPEIHGPVPLHEAVPGGRREKGFLSKIWFKMAKLEGKAE